MLFAACMQSASKDAGADHAASPIEFSLDSKGCPCHADVSRGLSMTSFWRGVNL
jgi:hypothetical protein